MTKYIMRQTRDGAVELIDSAPTKPDGGLSAMLASVKWRTVVVWYMRTLAWVWLGKGLFNWALILGALPGAKDFATMTLPLQASLIAFACLNLLASVGLWLAAPWGGAIWLLCAVVESASPFLSPRAASIGYFGALLNVALILGYFLLSWRAVRERA
jgi:hypothetical protein